MPVRAVLFDIGGVLELTPSTGWQARWEAELGLREGEIARRLAPVWQDGALGKLTETEAEALTRVRLGLDDAQLQRFLSDTWSEYLGTPNVELIEYFGRLRSRVRTAIISNSFVGARQREQQRYGFADRCDLVVYSHEVGFTKPDPRIFLLACERLGVAPAECLFVDDVAEHAAAARALGMRAITFHDNQQVVPAIEAALGT